VIIVRGTSEVGSDLRGPTFTGDVWADSVLPQTDGVIINNVVFTPGARTFWHQHEQGQILLVTAGRGWVCSHGDKALPLRAGDVVWTQPGERHWHGAAVDSVLIHTAISLGTTHWLNEVDPGEYAGTADHSASC
jgi:quercetin dioxygenase-like cupin family protein